MSGTAYDVKDNVDLSGSADQYINSHLSTIDGWLSKHEAGIFCLIDEAQRSCHIAGDIVDLGVWHGRSALLLFQFLDQKERLFAIDIFDLRSTGHRYFNDPAIFLGHCDRLGVDQRLQVIRANTAQNLEMVAATIAAASCRIFHVDGGHDYTTAKIDIEFGATAIKPGGVLVCDDVFLRGFPGVTQALIEVLQRHAELAPIAISTKKIWITTIEHADIYREHLKARCKGAKFKAPFFMGSKVLIMV